MTLLDTLPLEIEEMIMEFKGDYKYTFEEVFKKDKKVKYKYGKWFVGSQLVNVGIVSVVKTIIVGLGVSGSVVFGLTLPISLGVIIPCSYLIHRRVYQKKRRRGQLIKKKMKRHWDNMRFLTEVGLSSNSNRQRIIINNQLEIENQL